MLLFYIKEISDALVLCCSGLLLRLGSVVCKDGGASQMFMMSLFQRLFGFPVAGS